MGHEQLTLRELNLMPANNLSPLICSREISKTYPYTIFVEAHQRCRTDMKSFHNQ